MDVTIRHALPDDYVAVHAIYLQPRACAATLQLPWSSPEVWKQRLATPHEQGATLVACTETDIVGSLGLFIATQMRRRHVATLGMGVHDQWQNQGIGTRLLATAIDLADNWYNITRLELTVFVDNEPGIRLYRRAGFEVEGTHKQYAYRDGEYADSYCMARLRGDVALRRQ